MHQTTSAAGHHARSREQATQGSSSGAPSRLEIVLADRMMAMVPSLERVRFVNSGTEATMAVVIVEPVVGNMGVVAPQPGFLEGLRRFCTEHGAVLILDEVMNGFRPAKGGAQERFGVYFHERLRRGVMLAPSQFEANFISAAHTPADIATTVEATVAALEIAHA